MTLIELVMSVTILSIAMGAVTSTIVVALRAVDTEATPVGNTMEAAEALRLIQADLASAIGIVELEPSAITIAVPDRDSPADGNPEFIRYEWSGTAGDPLFVQYNTRDKYVLCEDVHAFNVAQFADSVYVDRTMHENNPAPADYSWGYFTVDGQTQPTVIIPDGGSSADVNAKAASLDSEAETKNDIDSKIKLLSTN